ncbi:MAG TPA: metal ABC transporter permease [Bacteroidetes bacterium]|nr:metal ABC transporter permease [Bacteroidota bacterium]
MDNLVSLFSYEFFTRAVLAALLAAVSCGIIGTYIVSRRLVFISGGISHASFGGIGLGYFLGVNPLAGAAVYAVLNALGLEYLTRRMNIREDSVIGILWSFGMAVGIIFIYFTPGYAPNLMSYLFGSILTVSAGDLWFLLTVTGVSGLFFLVLYRWIVYMAFDLPYIQTFRLPVGWISYMLMVLMALTIVVNIRVVGIILVISLLTIPQTIANIFTRNFGRMILYSILTGMVASLGGLMISFYFDIPSGASIIFLLSLLFILARGLTALLSGGARGNIPDERTEEEAGKIFIASE